MRHLPFALAAATAVLASPALAHADDKLDCIAAFDASQALRADRKLTLALPKLATCARDVCPRSMQKVCVEQSDEVAALLPTVVLAATDAADNPIVDVAISIDGVFVTGVLDGKSIPVDPGLHTFRFERAGSPAVEHRVAVKEGQKGQPVAAQFGHVDGAPATPPIVPLALPLPPSTPAVQPLSATPETPAPRPSGTVVILTPARWVAIAAVSAGVVGVAIGTVDGDLSAAKLNDSKQECATGCVASSPARTTYSRGETYATYSDIAFIAGGTLAAGGVALFILGHPKAHTSTTAFVPSLGGLSVVGTFQ